MTRREIPREHLCGTQLAALDLLNRLVQLDSVAMRNLCEYRTEVNIALAQSNLLCTLLEEVGVQRLGLIGILGGILNDNDCRLTAHYEEGKLFRFSFTEWKE